MAVRRRAIVVGAGPAGLATAIALKRSGTAVTVYERAHDLSTAGTGLTLWPNGLRALDSFDAGDAVRAVSLAAPGMSMKSRTGRVLSEVSGAKLDRIGGRGVAAHRADLLSALAGQLDGEALRFGVGCSAVRSEAEQAVATFDDGSELAADLVVGADGIRSKVRSASRISAPLAYGGCTVWRAVTPFSLPDFPGLMTLGGANQFGMWRLPGDRIYWFASAPAAEGAQSRGPSRPPALFSAWHEPIPALLSATPTDRIVVTDIYDSAPLSTWSAGRVVLVGDAAHPSMPNMGQGTSQAFEDAAVLARCVTEGTGIGAALAEYESMRRRRARLAWSQARQLAWLGGIDNAVLCWLRDRLMSAAPAGAQLRQLERLFDFDGHS